MSQREELNFPWGRWLLWGLVAIAVLVAITLFFVNLGEDVEAGSTTPQVEWSIQVSEYAPSPGEVILKGDIPLGFPTETWKDGFMLARSVDARQFEWNMDVKPEVPVPVYEIDQAQGSCEDLNGYLNDWATQVGQAPGDAQRTQAEAFAQHALDTMLADGCDPGLDD